MMDRHCSDDNSDASRARPRWGSLANGNSFLELLQDNSGLQPTALTLAPVDANIYSRRHSAHSCPTIEKQQIPPPVPLRPPPTVPKRNNIPPATITTGQKPHLPQLLLGTNNILPPLPVPPPTTTRNRVPPVPPARTPKPTLTNNLTPPPTYGTNCTNISPNSNTKRTSPKPNRQTPTTFCAFDFNSKLAQEYSMASSPSTVSSPKSYYKSQRISKTSMRQDSGISSDSFSQTSSPSYTSKTMETPLLPPRTPPFKQSGGVHKLHRVHLDVGSVEDEKGNQNLPKSVSTPASLQTIVKLQNGSNISLHHKIMKDMRRPSKNYMPNTHLRFRFFQLVLNALALLAIGGGMMAYFKAYPLEVVKVVNNTIITNITNTAPIVIYEQAPQENPAPGICLPVIVNFCQQHKVPYNYTIFPNFMGHFGQPEAQQELEVYDALVDVRCYELSALFLCSIFVPKCGPNGALVGPCRNLCMETKQRCGFFLNVFGLEIPDYLLKCNYFPNSTDTDVCIGHKEVIAAKNKAKKNLCLKGFQCDGHRCIPADWRCDGHVDCQDQTDEIQCNRCKPGMIHCGQNRCMSQEHICDGIVDCPFAQDERNCLRLSERNGDEGRGQLEVYRPIQKQWIPACVRHWDPTRTADHICSLLGYSNASKSLWKGPDRSDIDFGHETTTKWRMRQIKQSKNMMKDFGSCRGKTYPTLEVTCVNHLCGKIRRTYAERNRRAKRIVGGNPAKPGDWPFLAAILGGSEQIFYCAGVLIADQWVLTASHCVGNHSDVSGWTIQLGITRRHSHAFYGQKVRVKRVVPHPKYNMGIAHDNDVALFQLAQRVTFHEHMLPICLPSPKKELRPGTVCTVIGWGKKEDSGLSEYSPEINEVDVPILNRDLCNKWLENRDLNVTDGMICAGYQEGGKDACQGDSGGPLLCRDEHEWDKWFVGGIVSWGIKCAHPQLPGVYAYVPRYVPWILEQMQNYTD